MLDKLEAVANRYEELTSLLSDPEVVGDRQAFAKYAKEHAELEPVVNNFKRWKTVNQELEDNKELLKETNDSEFRELAQEEIKSLEQEKTSLYDELQILLLPKDPNDEKNIVLEIRAGAGGDESAIFSGDLFSLYSRYAEKNNWKVEMLSSSESSVGGFKEVIARIEGSGAYSCFKYESGVHRVQRVPTTETQGRVHTSTVTVAIMPEAEEVDVQINDNELRVDVFRASGPGGQSVNTTDSAVRITHLPTNIVVTCQDEKSQIKNKAKAMTVLRARLLDAKQAEQDAEIREDRRSQIGSGERSERIRTYNFPQGRITDHRIGLTLYQLEDVMGGNLDAMVEPLRTHYQAEALKGEED